MAARLRVLLANAEAAKVAHLVDAEALGVDLTVATTPEEAEGAAPPDVAFVTKSRGFHAPFHAWLLAQPSLKWLHVGGSGYDHVGPWQDKGIVLTNCAGVLAPFLAQTCLGAMIAINNNLLLYRDQQRAQQWQVVPFRPLAGQTLVIVGMGEIGRRLGAMARAIGLRVIGIRRTQGSMAEADEIRPPEALKETLAEADIVSVHLRLSDETHHMFDAGMFAAMKPGALFMNTGRGGLVDEVALLSALEGHLRGAYLDVFETEPLPAESPIWDHPKIFMTPHASDGTVDWEHRFTLFFVENLKRWQAGTPMINVV